MCVRPAPLNRRNKPDAMAVAKSCGVAMRVAEDLIEAGRHEEARDYLRFLRERLTGRSDSDMT